MNFNIQNFYDPCENCKKSQYGFGQSTQCNKCQFYISIQILKKVLQENDYCQHCEHKKSLGGGYFDCINDFGDIKCEDFAIDWNSVIREYKINLS